MNLRSSILMNLIAFSTLIEASDAPLLQIVADRVYETEEFLSDKFAGNLVVTAEKSVFDPEISIIEARIYDQNFVHEIENLDRQVTLTIFNAEGNFIANSFLSVELSYQQGDPKGRCARFSFSTDSRIVGRVVMGIYSDRRFQYFRVPVEPYQKAN